MSPASPARRTVVIGVVALATVAGSLVRERVGWGRQGAEGAAAKDLLAAQPFDRVTLIDGTVLEIEPVSPRPLPPYDPTKDEKSPQYDKSKAKKKGRAPAENVRLSGKGAAKAKEPEQINEINIHILGPDGGDFRVRRGNIKSLEYFEDMLLAEGDRLLLSREYAKAFEHYLAVKLRNPAWKGLGQHVDKLLFEEGKAALLLDLDHEKGLRLLRELYTRRPDYPGLPDILAKAYAGRIEDAFNQEAFSQGRKILHDLDLIAPNHEVGQKWRDRFIARARGLAREAERKQGAERLDRLAEALRIWPGLKEAVPGYEEAFKALPTLDVGVVDLAASVGPWVRCPADERATRLSFLPYLEVADEEAMRGKRPDQLGAGMEVEDLGRRLFLRLRDGVAWSDGSRTVGAADVARALADRASPSYPGFKARWAELLERIEPREENQVEVRLTHVPLRPESWLLGPIGPAHAAADGLVPTPGGGRKAVGDGPFLFDSTSEKERAATYLAWRDAGSTGAPKVRRVREVRLSDGSAAVGALLRGEVTLLERVPPDRVAALTRAEGIKVGRYERPSVHVIAIDGRNPSLRNRSLRRGLSYAVDRKGLLEETLLRRPVDEANGPADGPFPRGSYADSTDVKPLEYDPLLARMLVAAAKKELNSSAIKLTFEYPAIPEARAVAPKLVEALTAAGLEIKAVERPESELESSLRAGRRFDLAYRALRVGEPALEAGPLLCPGYDAPPAADGLAAIASPRTMQLLLQLERVPEWPSARAMTVQLDRESRDELPVIPLWQLQDHYAWRTRLKGPADATDALYKGIETWEIEPWFAKDPW
jgi:peptide/nickel transport system substrate-binding protein